MMSDWMARLLCISVPVFVLDSCTVRSAGPEIPVKLTTFDRVLPLAAAGNAEFQNLLGFMHYHGEGVEQNMGAARRWFRLSADNGHPVGRINDAYLRDYLRSLAEPASGRSTFREESERSGRSRTGRPGERTYMTFCAGCHGLNGVAAYCKSPSFALNERMEKTDEQLLRSVSDGIGEMPGWGGKIPDHELRNVIAFIRTFRDSYLMGISETLRESPPIYFLFGPMSCDHTAFRYR